MKELVRRIAFQLIGIDTEEFSRAEANIADMLVDEGILKEKKTGDETVLVLVD